LKESHKTCDPVVINRFFDKELGPEEHARINDHIKSCPSCRKTLEDLEALSTLLKVFVKRSSETGYGAIEESILDAIRKKQTPWWIRGKEMFLSKKSLIPAVGIACIAVVFFTLFRTPVSPGPSAIITSLSSDVSSFVIMETSQTHHTIFWFNEKT